VAEEGGVGAAQQSEVAEDEQDADLGGTEDALRELEAGQGVGGEVAFARQKQKGDEHGDGDGPVREARAAEAAHQRDGAEDVDHVIDVEAVARTLVAPDAGESAVHAVAEPIEDEAQDDQQQSIAVVAR